MPERRPVVHAAVAGTPTQAVQFLAAVLAACLPRIVGDASIGPALLAVLVALVGLSLGGVYQQRNCQGLDSVTYTAIGLTASLPWAALMAPITPAEVSDWPQALLLLLAMVVLTSMLATTLYAECIRRAGARGASILFAIIPAVAAVMARVMLGDTLTGWAVLGIALGATACLLQARSS